LITSPEFPAPIAVLSIGNVWAYDDVVKWGKRRGRVIHPVARRD
jgi:hypothetical protein